MSDKELESLFIGYGYKPWKAFIFMAVFLILGMAVFYGAGFRGLMMPTQARAGGAAPSLSTPK